MGRFERRVKRELTFKTEEGKRFPVIGLQDSPSRNIINGSFEVKSDDLWKMFQPSLQEVSSLMRSQLKRSRNTQDGPLNITKVILIGGFGQSEALQEHLRAKIGEWNKKNQSNIELLVPDIRPGPGVAVASGGVLRALNKRTGPDRMIRSSYGILCKEKWDDDFPGHKEAEDKLEWDLDGEPYVKDSMVWFIQKGQIISSDPKERKFRIPMVRIISPKVGESFVCTETLYVSDVCTESHYQKTHPKNKMKYETAGKIRVDLSFLKKKNRLERIIPPPGEGRPHYKLEFEVILEVIDRNLYYKAVYPIGEDGCVLEGSKGWTNISAAFKPGTN